jgi:hypothetical protein
MDVRTRSTVLDSSGHFYVQKWCMNASDWRPLRLKDDDYEDAETNGPDDERMSIFGCSEWPKPIVGRPTIPGIWRGYVTHDGPIKGGTPLAHT